MNNFLNLEEFLLKRHRFYQIFDIDTNSIELLLKQSRMYPLSEFDSEIKRTPAEAALVLS
jgi:hypothetical protein